MGFNTLLGQIAALWNQTTAKKKLIIIMFGLALVATVSGFVYLLNRVDYAVLYSGLSTEDSSSIITRLKELKVEYRVSPDGTVVEVPADKVSELRLQIAGEGLPMSGKIGFELFDKTTFGITDFTQKINLRRALEGELSRTISHLKEVKSASIHLVIPEEKLFKEDQEKAKASVVLALKGGLSLSKEQVTGIAHLVASAVPGLVPEAVAVLDNAGNVLSLPTVDEESQLLSKTQLEYRHNLEKDYEKTVLSILEPITGEGRVKARVSVALNLNRVEQTSEVYDPNKSVLVQSTKNEEFIPESKFTGGIAGTRANTPQPTPPGAAAPATTTTTTTSPATARIKSQESSAYQVSRTVRKETLQTGDIRKATVAVIVDHRQHTTKGPDGKDVIQNVPWAEKDLKDLRSLITASIGLDETRGDVLSVLNIPFSMKEVLAPAEEPGLLEKYQNLIPVFLKFSGILFLLALVYILLLRPIRRKLAQVIDVSVAQRGVGALVPSASQMAVEGPISTAAVLPAAEVPEQDQASIAYELTKKLQKSQNVKAAQIQKMAQEETKKNPEKVASLIRSWLSE